MKNIITILLLLCTLSVSAQQKLHVDRTNGQSLVYYMSAVRQLNVSTDYKDLIIQMKNGSKIQESIHNVDKFYFTQENKLIGIWEATSQSEENMTYIFFDNNMCSYYGNGYNRAEEGIPYSFSDGKLIIDGKEIDYTLDGDNLSFTYGYNKFVGERVYTVDDETEQQYRNMLKGTWKGTREDYYSPDNVLFSLLEDGTFQQIEYGAVEYEGNWAVCGNKVMITEPLHKSGLGSTWTIISLTADRMVLVDEYGYKMEVEKKALSSTEKLIGIWEATSQSEENMTYIFFDNNMCSYYENGYNRAEVGIPYSFSDGKLIIDGKEIDYTLDGDNLSFIYGYKVFVGKRVFTVDEETEQQYRNMLKGTWKGTKEGYYSPHNVLFSLLEDGTFQDIEYGVVEYEGNWAVCGNKVMITEPKHKSVLGHTWTIISLTADRMVLVDEYGYKMEVEKYTKDPIIENVMTIDGKRFAIETVETKRYDDRVKLEFVNRTNGICCILDFYGSTIPIANNIALCRLEIEDEAEHKISGGAYDGTAYADVLQDGYVIILKVDNQIIKDKENNSQHVVSLSYIFK